MQFYFGVGDGDGQCDARRIRGARRRACGCSAEAAASSSEGRPLWVSEKVIVRVGQGEAEQGFADVAEFGGFAF